MKITTALAMTAALMGGASQATIHLSYSGFDGIPGSSTGPTVPYPDPDPRIFTAQSDQPRLCDGSDECTNGMNVVSATNPYSAASELGSGQDKGLIVCLYRKWICVMSHSNTAGTDVVMGKLIHPCDTDMACGPPTGFLDYEGQSHVRVMNPSDTDYSMAGVSNNSESEYASMVPHADIPQQYFAVPGSSH